MNASTTPAAQPVTLPAPSAPRNQRAFAVLQLKDSRKPPPAELVNESETVLALHLPEAMRDGGLSVEMVFNGQMGLASARARAFLVAWLKLRRYKPAFELAGCQGAEINLWRNASPAFEAIFNTVDMWIRSHRHAESEDTLHALANGEIEKTHGVLDRDGNPVTVSDGKIYDSKALALELAAGDPKRYGNQGGTGGGAQVVVQFNMFAPQAPNTVQATVKPAAAASDTEEDADVVPDAPPPVDGWYTP